MSWIETAPGLYQRPLGGSEPGMIAVISAERPMPREPIRIHAFAHMTTSYPAEKFSQAVRDSWKALRLLRSPDIATTAADGFKQYQVPTPDELDSWQRDTVLVAPPDTPVNDVVKQMSQNMTWLPVLYMLPQTTDDGSWKGTIILFISHWRTEASGCFQMLDQLLDYAADLLQASSSTRDALARHQPGDEVSLLTPVLEDMVMPDKASPPESAARVGKRIADFDAAQPTIDLETQAAPTAAPSPVKVHQRTYSAATTGALASACRRHTISVTSAIHSAYVSAVTALAPPSKRSLSTAIMMPAQARKRLPPTSPYRSNGCWDAARMLLLLASPDSTFLDRARSLRAQYALADTDAWLYEDMRELTRQLAQGAAKLTMQPTALPWFTSFGVLDGDVIRSVRGGVTVDRVMAWADPVGPGIVLTMWTFGARLTVQISYNGTFHADGQVEEIQRLIGEAVAQELGIEMAVDEVKGMDSWGMT